MGDRGLVSWNSMISGYSKMGFAKQAIVLFMEMREEGFEPDEMTLVSVLGACGDLGDLGLGRWVDCVGDLISARRVFDSMPNKDVVTWNAFITGCAQNGASNEAIVLFNEMREAGPNPDKVTMIEVLSACSMVGALDLGKWVETHASERGPASVYHYFRRMSKDNDTVHPNDITFIGVLSACVHAGLVDEGRQLFESMSLSFGLVPKVEHYSCMVDLCARAGLLYEAWDFNQRRCLENQMKSCWGLCLVPARGVEMQMWDDCAKMRVLMRQCGVSKTPGCSWIDIGARVHEFHAGDSLHHHLVIIYQLLNEEMKREGYVPNTDCI
ncbi:hypothetical protein OIU76_027191 [Salix suchowensis]|nr:hypothetical protein OIU76_027191 [Salix suchowensis]